MDKEKLIQTRNEIKQLKLEKEEQERILQEARNKISSIIDSIEEKESQIRVYDYYDAVRSYLSNAKHPEKHWIDRDTTTRDLMTNLSRGCYRQKYYDSKMHEYVEGKKVQVDYYIVNDRYILLYSGALKLKYDPQIHSSLTATEFKKRGILYDRPLKNNLNDMLVLIKDGKTVRLFDQPIQLCAQTYDDMDYRKEYVNGFLEYEGNNYGDTSSFYFVGELY